MAEESETDQLYNLLDGYVNREEDLTGIKYLVQSNLPQRVLSHLLSIKNESGFTAIHKAVQEHATIRLDYLLQRLNANQRFELLKTQDNMEWSPIHHAAIDGRIDTLELLLGLQTCDQTFELLRIQNEEGWTAIHQASSKDNASAMKYILGKVAKPGRICMLLQMRNIDDNSAVFEGLRKGHTETVSCMLECVAESAWFGLLRNALHCAALQGQEKVIDGLSKLITSESLFNLMIEKNNRSQTPVHNAMSQGHTEVVGAMLNLVSKRKNQCMKLLTALDNDANTPTHCAATGGHTNALEHVLSFLNADQMQQLLEMRNKRGQTAIDTAVICGHEETADSLRQHCSTLDPGYEYNQDVEMGEPDASQDLGNPPQAALAEKVAELEKKQSKTDDRQERTEKRLDISETNTQNLRKEQHVQSQRLEDLEENVVYREVPTGGQQNTDSLYQPVMEEGVPDDADEDNM